MDKMVIIITITIIISNQMWLSMGLSCTNGFILMGFMGFIHGIINGIINISMGFNQMKFIHGIYDLMGLLMDWMINNGSIMEFIHGIIEHGFILMELSMGLSMGLMDLF